jgi:transcriptional regulator with XRE-family HTH domain
MFAFTPEIAIKLANLRKQSKLSQTEVASRMGINPKTGQSYIAQLEKGMIKNPFMSTILNYLDAVGVSWITFFTELSKLRSKQSHQEIMSEATQGVILTLSNTKGKNLMKKLDRDTLLYETKIKPPQNFYTKVDIEIVKQKIDLKIKEYLHTLQVNDRLIPHYLSFAFDVLHTSKYQPLIEKYHISGISKHYLIKIINIVNKIYRAEEKKVQKQKPIRLEKANAMAVKYVQSRIKLEPIEAEVSKLLAEYNLTNHVSYNSYMNFARECYSKIRKFHIKDPLLLKQHLNDLTKGWLEAGLKPEIMEKIKEIVLKPFASKDNI